MISEVNPDSEFHVPRRIGLASDLAKRRGAGQTETRAGRVAGLKMVEHVGNGEEQHYANALLINADIFNNVRVEVPGGKSAHVRAAAATGIEAQHARPELGVDRGRIREGLQGIAPDGMLPPWLPPNPE